MRYVNFIINGVNGRMGRKLCEVIAGKPGFKVVCGIDKDTSEREFPVFATPDDCTLTADVIIDFSHPSCLGSILWFATGRNIPIVIATTGFSELQLEEIRKASAKIPVFHSSNMSLGMAALMSLTQKAARVLGESYDIEIIESHHNQKLDAPSGTAIMLAEGINEVCDNRYSYIYDRHEERRKRSASEIGIHTVRGGTIVGEHEIMFAGHDEVITITHKAYSREIFATGAVNAAQFLLDKPIGLYAMKDIAR